MHHVLLWCVIKCLMLPGAQRGQELLFRPLLLGRAAKSARFPLTRRGPCCRRGALPRALPRFSCRASHAAPPLASFYWLGAGDGLVLEWLCRVRVAGLLQFRVAGLLSRMLPSICASTHVCVRQLTRRPKQRDEVRCSKGGEAMVRAGASLSHPLPLPPNLKRLVDARFQVCKRVCGHVLAYARVL